MKKNYFLTLAVFGLFGVVVVAYALMGKYAFQMLSIKDSQFEKYNGIAPILAGMLVPPAVGAYFDRKYKIVNWFPKIVVIPVLIYLSGVVVGVGANFIVNGMNDSMPMSYVTAPFLALTLYGVPCAVIIGILFYLVNDKLLKRTA